MPQITITADSDELRNRLLAFAQTYSSLTAIGMDAETDVAIANEISSSFIDKLLEETEENSPQSVPEPPKVPIGWVAQHKKTKGVLWSKLFSTAEYGHTRLKGDLAENVLEHYEIVPVYV